MKLFINWILCLFIITGISSCDVLNQVATDVVNQQLPAPAKLSNEDVISGLKEALNVGIKNAVNLTSITDGFLGNAKIKLPFPQDAIAVKQKALEWGLSGQVDKFETTLNRAAEEASKSAVPVFANAIKNMTIQDGFKILNDGNGAATRFLKDKTTAELTTAFTPIVKNAISKVKLTDYWNPIMTKYNTAMTLTNGKKVNPDLNAYVTQKAIDGLFVMVEQEENKIRQDPAARITDILKKVFGSVK